MKKSWIENEEVTKTGFWSPPDVFLRKTGHLNPRRLVYLLTLECPQDILVKTFATY